jgi:hypothetical protein
MASCSPESQLDSYSRTGCAFQVPIDVTALELKGVLAAPAEVGDNTLCPKSDGSGAMTGMQCRYQPLLGLSVPGHACGGLLGRAGTSRLHQCAASTSHPAQGWRLQKPKWFPLAGWLAGWLAGPLAGPATWLAGLTGWPAMALCVAEHCSGVNCPCAQVPTPRSTLMHSLTA